MKIKCRGHLNIVPCKHFPAVQVTYISHLALNSPPFSFNSSETSKELCLYIGVIEEGVVLSLWLTVCYSGGM